MAFVFEDVPDEGKEYLKKFKLIDLSQNIPLNPGCWIIDKENNYILVGLLGGAIEGHPWVFCFIYKEKKIHIEAYSNSFMTHWRVYRLSIPKGFEGEEKEILNLIRFALKEKSNGPFKSNNVVLVRYDCTPYYYEEK